MCISFVCVKLLSSFLPPQAPLFLLYSILISHGLSFLSLSFVFCLLIPFLLCSPFPLLSFLLSLHNPTRRNTFLNLNNHNHCYTHHKRSTSHNPTRCKVLSPTSHCGKFNFNRSLSFSWCFPHSYAIRRWGDEGALRRGALRLIFSSS